MVCRELAAVNGRFLRDCDRLQPYPPFAEESGEVEKAHTSSAHDRFSPERPGSSRQPCGMAGSRPAKNGIIYGHFRRIGASAPSRTATLGPNVARFLLKPDGLMGYLEQNKPR
jgi:hypothetical protein